MVINMKNYLMIEQNKVTNVCLWDGDVNTWQPPVGILMLSQETTATKVWKLNEDGSEYVLTDSIGDAQIGFDWNGSVCITNQEKPTVDIIPTAPSGEIPVTNTGE